MMSFDPQSRSLTLAGPQGATHSSQVLPFVHLPEASRVCGSHGLTHLGPHGPEAAVPWTVGSFPFPCVLPASCIPGSVAPAVMCTIGTGTGPRGWEGGWGEMRYGE